ncbi:hypothetical protein [Thiocapsa bogorovii]|uniref:hypothetical protein n=1 Tax=Thiocapsa bogorovii TaxID=521689 RepID=UPI001E5AAF1A|nr:hypothetical protein [Thiocapsa bogorovii]UHD17005.1 hypothetical protein LT988_02795 [Thiocapsa bogorovii]
MPALGNDDQDRIRAKQTIEILGLNIRDQLNRKRKEKLDDCLRHISDYVSTHRTFRAQSLKLVQQTTAKAELIRLRDYASEFSSVADACIEKEAPEALKKLVHDGAVG